MIKQASRRILFFQLLFASIMVQVCTLPYASAMGFLDPPERKNVRNIEKTIKTEAERIRTEIRTARYLLIQEGK